MKKKYLLIAVIALTVIAIIANVYTTNKIQPKEGIKIITPNSEEIVITDRDFEKAGPETMKFTLTKRNGESFEQEDYAAQIDKVIDSVVENQEYEQFTAVASDNFEADYTKDEIEDNIYLTYNSEDNSYGIVAAKDEFATRSVKDIKIIKLS